MRPTTTPPFAYRSWLIALLIGLIFAGLAYGLRYAIEGTGSTDPHSWLDLALLLGELPRLQDSPEGYGPRGKDFISHVTFPPEILDAWRQLREDDRLAGALQARLLS